MSERWHASTDYLKPHQNVLDTGCGLIRGRSDVDPLVFSAQVSQLDREVRYGAGGHDRSSLRRVKNAVHALGEIRSD